jgi:uncharacterized protein (TIGR03435 family)
MNVLPVNFVSLTKRHAMNRLAVLFLSCCALFAQQPTAPQAYDVVAIKPSDPNDRRIMMRNMPGTLSMTGVTLKLLIQQAYGVQDFQVSGGPGWVGSDRFGIEAKVLDAPVGPPPDFLKMSEQERNQYLERNRVMLRGLLEDRFQLKVHHESKDMPVYALVVAKGGPKLKDNGGKTSDPNMKPGMMRMGPAQLTGSQMPISALVNTLSQQLGRTVVDQTGLKGNYDFELKWTPDLSQGGGPFGGGPLPPGVEAPDPNGPTVFTAVQEQLGLKLESQKGPVDVIVIDQAAKPSEN